MTSQLLPASFSQTLIYFDDQSILNCMVHIKFNERMIMNIDMGRMWKDMVEVHFMIKLEDVKTTVKASV